MISEHILITVLISDVTCQYWSQTHSLCYLHNAQEFGNIINILSAVLSLIAVILEFIILFFVKDLQLYGFAEEPQLIGSELQPISSTRNETDGEFNFVNILIQFRFENILIKKTEYSEFQQLQPKQSLIFRFSLVAIIR